MNYLEVHIQNMPPEEKKLLIPVVTNPTFNKMTADMIAQIEKDMTMMDMDAPDFKERYRLFRIHKEFLETWRDATGKILKEIGS